MDCRIGKIGKMIKLMLKDLWKGIKERVNSLLFVIGFLSLVSSMIFLSKSSPAILPLIPLFVSVYSVLFSMLSGAYVDELKSKREIRGLKSAVLLELRYILISLIENFTRFYEVYFATLRFFKFDLRWFYKLTEKYREYFPDYLMNEIEICKSVYEDLEKSKQSKHEDVEKTIKFLEEYIRKMRLRSQCPMIEDVQHHFENEESGDRENKPSINPIHMEILSSTLNKLSALDKDFVENILYIWHEINKLNKEIEVLEGLSRTEPILICSIAQRIERIATKIDEILEKEGTNL